MKGSEYSVSLYLSAVITDQYNVMANGEELIGNEEQLTLWARCRINRCRYNRGSTLKLPFTQTQSLSSSTPCQGFVT